MKIGSRKDRFCEFDHHRKVAPVDARTVIRMKRDAFWSAAGSDVDAGATTVTLPDAAAASPWAVINCAPVRRDTVCADQRVGRAGRRSGWAIGLVNNAPWRAKMQRAFPPQGARLVQVRDQVRG
jgi:hypothetical protein